MPVVLALPALLAVGFLLLPLIGILARTEWAALGTHLTSPGVTEALGLSLLVSGWALALSLLLGVPLAWLLARTDIPGKAFIRTLVMLPMVLPPTVGGVALLLGFGRRGLLGPWLEDSFGITLPFHTSGAVIAATFVAMPFLVISLEGALNGLRPEYEETAASLGASPLRVFFTVTVPMAAPGLIAGAALTWARALGEFGATITFAGNLPGVTQTLPLQVYLLLQEEPAAATSVSLLLLAIAMAVLIALRGRWTGGAGADRTEAAPADGPEPDREEEAGGADGAPAPDPGAQWSLHAEVTGFTRLALDAAPGTTVAVVGPNGAGKTTLLRALLGLTPRARAALRLGGDDVTGLPPHRRAVAWVPQHGALFPHLTALGNTAYGLRAHGVPRAEARREARQWLDRLGVGRLAHHRPAQLSGGQAQRVALARALAARPKLLLLDEPLAALDQTTRARVRHLLRRHLDSFGGVCLIVTHDPVEALSLADRVLVLDGGEALQDAPPAEVTRRPRSPWVARMLGRNAWPGTAAADGSLTLRDGGRLVVAEPPPAGAEVLAVIAPEAVAVHRERPAGSPRNVWPGTVREITASGGRLRVLVVSAAAPDLVAEITPQAAAELGLAEGEQVWTSVKATEVVTVRL
ncbi:ABC transporter permease [Streptomyces tsukubensis]|uniref:Molybdate ABC transporter permease subunit n=1 Tax=Streptomyces tsukubensis (strain DSM 42081 / NBRC 108919 / NRRL 18488 / 9993) TaxID=1114943 RepID=A0A7G3UR54_STRT9|nr:ABC transporter permease [Streptomyces tsukubensis]QKM71871.1 molybdate ABC transporter permease subunit [Streptomyces tsukubensis NRRL18488]TAI46534.1 molybdate ABC transporter permease subunit [Streptomyces tsukubensis]